MLTNSHINILDVTFHKKIFGEFEEFFKIGRGNFYANLLKNSGIQNTHMAYVSYLIVYYITSRVRHVFTAERSMFAG